jgi:hypothetical protein
MKTLLALALAGLLSGCAAPGGVRNPGAAEPAVQHLVSEDDHVRVDELRVRGQTQRLTVQNKDSAAPSYDILQPTPGQDPSKSRDAAGQRVWPVLTF